MRTEISLRATELAALNEASALLGGGQVVIAKACGLANHRHVWPWFSSDEATFRRIPLRYCLEIERVTRLINPIRVVRCERLRTDVTWARGNPEPDWPEGKPLLDVEAVPA